MLLKAEFQIDPEILEILEEYWVEEYEKELRHLKLIKD